MGRINMSSKTLKVVAAICVISIVFSSYNTYLILDSIRIQQEQYSELQNAIDEVRNRLGEVELNLLGLANEINVLNQSAHVPVEEYDYIVFQDEALVKAKNGKSGAIDFISTNASTVVNQAIAQGNNVYICGEYTLSSNLLVYNKKNARIIGANANMICNGKKIIIKGDNFTKSQNNFLSGLEIINGTVRIENSFRTTITNTIFRNCTTAIELLNTENWSEGTKIENSHFINCTESIVFRTPINLATGSYANTKIDSCFFNLFDNSVGIRVEPDAGFTDSLIQNARMWIGEFGERNQTGISLEGSMLQTLLQNVVFESFARLPINLYAVEMGQDAEPPILGGGVVFLGDWTARIHNPFGKWIFGSGGSFKRENVSIPVDLDNIYGSTQIIDAYLLEITSFKARIRVGGTFGYGETLTIRFRLEFIDNTISKSIEKSFNQIATLWLDDGDYFELTSPHNIGWAILVGAKTNFNSTNTTVQVDVYGTTA